MAYKIYYSEDDGVQVILQQNRQGEWYTVHGGEFYVREGDQWLPYDHVGFYRYLVGQGLAKFSVGDKHKLLVNGRWKKVDRYGIYKYADDDPDILLGSMILDEEWDRMMAGVLDDMVHVKEHGMLPD